MKVAEMRMLRMFCGKTPKDRVSNEKNCEMAWMESVKEVLREQRQRWLKHIERMDQERGPVNTLHFKLDGKKN